MTQNELDTLLQTIKDEIYPEVAASIQRDITKAWNTFVKQGMDDPELQVALCTFAASRAFDHALRVTLQIVFSPDPENPTLLRVK